MRRTTEGIAIVAVLAVYVFFGSGGTWSFRRVSWQRDGELKFTERYYAALAEGFRHGRLDLPIEPSAKWKEVPNAYDFGIRQAHGMEWEMWDASLYNGRYYLYFSPVPVVLFYIPFRVLARAYPPDTLAAVFFCSWAFLVCVMFARRALAGRTSRVPFAIWILLIGLGNVVPFTLTFVRAYEVAIATGMAMTASWAYALLRWMETRATRHAVWMGVWLALAIATRPNLILLLLIACVVLWRHWRAALFAAIPIVIVGIAMSGYNYARFGDIFELGMTYQISYTPMWRVAPCSLCSVPEGIRLVNNVTHYVFWPPHFMSAFPYADLQRNILDPALSFTGGAEHIGGVGALNPLTLIGTAVAIVIALRRGGRSDATRATLCVMAAAWLIILGLSTCRWVTARYALDFMLLMITATAVCIEEMLAWLAGLDVRVRALAGVITAIALGTIAVCILLGFRGPDDAWSKRRVSELSAPGRFPVRGRAAPSRMARASGRPSAARRH